MRLVPILAIALAVLATASKAEAQTLRFASWNINGGEQTPAELEANARAAAEALGVVDVIALQEVIAAEQVAAIARGFGLEHWAISDFAPPVDTTGAWFRSLEVAVVSRLPIERAAEWDTTGREPDGDGFAPRTSAEGIAAEEVPVRIAFGEDVPSRGFLRADLGDDWSVYSVHWKSSRGDSCNAADLANAEQREDQAEGLALDLGRALQAGRSVVIAGDTNINAPGRAPRVGTDPAADCDPSGSCDGVCGIGGQDGYDDSLAILLAADPSVRLLSGELANTFVARFFPGGAIDHLLVAGPRASAFATATTPAVEGDAFFGSDHRPVLATLGAAGGEPEERDARIRRLLGEITDRAAEIEGMLTE